MTFEFLLDKKRKSGEAWMGGDGGGGWYSDDIPYMTVRYLSPSILLCLNLCKPPPPQMLYLLSSLCWLAQSTPLIDQPMMINATVRSQTDGTGRTTRTPLYYILTYIFPRHTAGTQEGRKGGRAMITTYSPIVYTIDLRIPPSMIGWD